SNAWWPASRPDHVLKDAPDVAVDSLSERMYVWHEGVDSAFEMVTGWHGLGTVRRQKVDPASVPVEPKALAAFRTRNYEELKSGETTQYFYYAEVGRRAPKHVEKSSGVHDQSA